MTISVSSSDELIRLDAFLSSRYIQNSDIPNQCHGEDIYDEDNETFIDNTFTCEDKDYYEHYKTLLDNHRIYSRSN